MKNRDRSRCLPQVRNDATVALTLGGAVSGVFAGAVLGACGMFVAGAAGSKWTWLRAWGGEWLMICFLLAPFVGFFAGTLGGHAIGKQIDRLIAMLRALWS